VMSVKNKRNSSVPKFTPKEKRDHREKLKYELSLRPPRFNPSPIIRVTRRFRATGTVSGNFTVASGHNQFLVVTVASTTAISYADIWRIRRVRIWSPITAVGADGFCSITPIALDTSQAFFNDRTLPINDTTTSADRPAFVEWVPKPNTPSGSWHATTSTNTSANLWTIAASAGSTVDIELDYTECTSIASNSYSTATGIASLGLLGSRAFGSGLITFGMNSV